MPEWRIGFPAAVVLAVSAIPGPWSAIAQPATITANPDALRVRVNAIAGHLTHFATHAIVTNRPLFEMQFPRGLREEQAKLLGDLQDLSRDSAELHRLLIDPDPHIRTIALGALFVREDKDDLPYLARLIGDAAATFPDLHDSVNAAGGVLPMSELEGPQSVGQVAGAMIQFYLEAAHQKFADRANGYSMTGDDLTRVFDRYWAEHKDRDHCASWFLVKLERATRETEAVPEQYRADVDSVLAQIGALPSPDREWTLLYALFGAAGPRPEYIVRDTALVYVAKAIGPAEMMKFLLLEPFSSDPDLRFTPAEPRGAVLFPISAFILDHAPQLLRPGDSAVLRANAFKDPQHFQGTTSLWIAAADWLLGIDDLSGGAARLKADFALFPPSALAWSQAEQMPLAVDLWRLRGAAEKTFLVHWFYGLSPEQNPSLQEEFLRKVEADARSDTQEFLSTIVADPRFEKTNWSVLAQLLHEAGAGMSNSLVPTTQIYSYTPNQLQPDEGAVFSSWRNVLRRHYGLPEYPFPGVP